MNIIYLISLFLFMLFFGAYIFKLIILYKREGIKANVLGKRGKDKSIHKTEIFVQTTTFVWGLSWLIFSIANLKSDKVSGLFIENDIMRLSGVLIMAFGLLIFISAMVSMKASWRVGIDKKTKSKLITSGIYKYSRNPAFIGFYGMFIGYLLIYFNIFTLIIVVLNFISIHLLILQEERHLGILFGNEYAQYAMETPRYILFK